MQEFSGYIYNSDKTFRVLAVISGNFDSIVCSMSICVIRVKMMDKMVFNLFEVPAQKNVSFPLPS